MARAANYTDAAVAIQIAVAHSSRLPDREDLSRSLALADASRPNVTVLRLAIVP